MFKIVDKKILADTKNGKITQLKVESRSIAESVKAGQFVVVIVSQAGERIPLTIVDKDADRGIVTLIFQDAGFTTHLLGKVNPGDSLYALAGPLGRPTEIRKYGKVIIVGGGVGIAEIYPVARGLKGAGNAVTTIIGARTKDLLILREELKAVSDELYIATDDGSSGRKGFTTDILKDLLANYKLQTTNYKLVYAVGPIPMMERGSIIARKFKVKATVSLNALMVDATGMCGCCRVKVGGQVKFSCLDGPEFDAQGIDWDELKARNRIYEDKEGHICSFYKL